MDIYDFYTTFSKSYYNLKHFVLVVLYEKMLSLLKCNVFRNNFSILEFIINKRIEIKMDWDFEKIIFLLNESTRLALSGSAKLSLYFKSDGSIVTQFDKQIEQFLFREIKKPSNFFLGGKRQYLLMEKSILKML